MTLDAWPASEGEFGFSGLEGGVAGLAAIFFVVGYASELNVDVAVGFCEVEAFFVVRHVNLESVGGHAELWGDEGDVAIEDDGLTGHVYFGGFVGGDVVAGFCGDGLEVWFGQGGGWDVAGDVWQFDVGGGDGLVIEPVGGLSAGA